MLPAWDVLGSTLFAVAALALLLSALSLSVRSLAAPASSARARFLVLNIFLAAADLASLGPAALDDLAAAVLAAVLWSAWPR
jgi:hypothetical protein